MATAKTAEAKIDTQAGPCPLCGGAGFYRYDVEPSDSRFGRAYPCVCKRTELEQRAARKLRADANVSVLSLERYTFATFDPKAARKGATATKARAASSLREAKGDAMAWAAEPDGWLVLCGSPGSGKTHLAYAVAGHLVAKEPPTPIYWSSVPDLLDLLRRGYKDERFDERFDAIREVDVLVLDDLGTEQETEWVAEKLFQILNWRWRERLPTVVTTNLRIWESGCGIAPRLLSRIKDVDLLYRQRYLVLRAGDYRGRGRGSGAG